MVRLFIKQEYRSNQNRLIVTDTKGQEVFLIVGKWGRVGNKLSVFSLAGERLIDVQQVILSLFPKFRLYKDGRKIGSLKKRPGLRGIKNPFFTITRLNWIITANYEKQQFTVRRFGKKIGTIDKSVTYMGDLYCVDFIKEQDIPVALAIAVLLDHYAENKSTVLKKYQQEKYSLSFMHTIWIKFKRKLWQKVKIK
ncbi:LURP-one-related/scramblase family protein [Alkalibacterium sp. 20]|uniref:LURP-one-related/scramblase family protein n=1 Tax=Alkalibacterium sp. 20 TaxID=1798803 RepID=UPI0008FFF0E9|nr:LURP-one-related family protein [Alkalibacterium sp. 20]OJF95935.1 hypothetical protein AX762_05780 [Alkalibacterium sp. 20]